MDDSDLNSEKLTDKVECQKAILFFQSKDKILNKNFSFNFDIVCQEFEDLISQIATLAFKKLYISHLTHDKVKKRVKGWARILYPNIEIIEDFKLDHGAA
jgi:hypothetical protein